MNKSQVSDYIDVQVSCENPLLIVHPSVRDYALRCDSYYIDGVCFKISDEQKSFILKDCDSISKILNLPYVHSLDEAKLQSLSVKDVQVFSHRLARFVNDSFFVDSLGHTFPIYTFVPCGHCDVCLHSKLVSYLQRAQFAYEESMRPVVFATLTYNDFHCPVSGVDKRDIQLFKKKFKRIFDSLHLDSHGIKFIISSEYGHKTHRPHYHCLIFGVPDFGYHFNVPNGSVSLQDFYVHMAVRYAWRDKERVSDLCYRTFEDYCNSFSRIYSCPDDYDSYSKGFCNVSILEGKSSNAVSYCLKYLGKDIGDNSVPAGKNKNFISVSKNLGVNFVKKNFYFDDFKFYSCDGVYCETRLCGYYLKKLLPSVSSLIPSKVRNAYFECLYLYDDIFNSDLPKTYKSFALGSAVFLRNLCLPLMDLVFPDEVHSCRNSIKSYLFAVDYRCYDPIFHFNLDDVDRFYDSFLIVYDFFKDFDFDYLFKFLSKREEYFSRMKRRSYSQLNDVASKTRRDIIISINKSKI